MDEKMDEKIIQFYMLSAGGHIPMKVMSGSAGYDFWPEQQCYIANQDHHQSGYGSESDHFHGLHWCHP